MVIAADVARPDELVVDHEAAHQEEVSGVKHLLQTGGQALMSLEEPELSQRRLLFLLSLLRERLLQKLATAIRPVLGREVQLSKQAIVERLGQVVIELLDEPLLTNQRHQLAPSLSEEALRGLGRRFEMPLQVRQPLALDLAGARGADCLTGRERLDRMDLLLETELVEGERRFLFREVDHEHAMLLLEDRLERLDVRVGVDRQRVGDSHRKRHDAVQLRPALEDHEGSGTAGLVRLEERLYLAQILGKAEALLTRQSFDVRFAGFEGLVPEAVEDTDEDGWVGTDESLGREVEIEGDDRALIVLAGDGF